MDVETWIGEKKIVQAVGKYNNNNMKMALDGEIVKNGAITLWTNEEWRRGMIRRKWIPKIKKIEWKGVWNIASTCNVLSIDVVSLPFSLSRFLVFDI